MKRHFLLLVIIMVLTSCSHTYYIVRHAEKAQPSSGTTMTTNNDPFLSAEGESRAQALKAFLKDKQIRYVFSTQTNRTLQTAAPVLEHFHLTPVIYSSVDRPFISKLRSLK